MGANLVESSYYGAQGFATGNRLQLGLSAFGFGVNARAAAGLASDAVRAVHRNFEITFDTSSAIAPNTFAGFFRPPLRIQRRALLAPDEVRLLNVQEFAAQRVAPRRTANLLDEIALPKDVQRALLREAMQSNGTGKFANHLIPLESLTKYKSLMERAARGGFNINGRNNGVLLDAIDHVGGHPGYNRVVLEELGRINRQARRLSDSEVSELIQDAADTLRRASEDGSFRPWF